MNHLVTLKIIAEKCRNNKSNLFCSFVDVRKYFDIVPRTNLWNILEGLKVPFELRVVAIRLHRKFISNFKNNEGWTTYINFNIDVKQCFPLSATLFGVYIDML